MLLFEEEIYLEYLRLRKTLDYSEVMEMVKEDFPNTEDHKHIMNEVEERFIDSKRVRKFHFNLNQWKLIFYGMFICFSVVVFIVVINSSNYRDKMEEVDAWENIKIALIVLGGLLIIFFRLLRKQRLSKMKGKMSEDYRNRHMSKD